LHDGEVRIYVCGLTPSAEAHLGHARSFMFFDVLRRFLVYRGYRVTFVQNVTDIDDRSIARGLETGVPWSTIVEGYYASFKRSMRRLNVLEPDREPRATAYIPEIVAMVGELIEAGHAYVVEDGVYYAVRSFARYGALSGRNIEELQIGARIAPGESKRDALDFALWKFAKPGEPSWPSPWGEGRPGWHIECSAMARALLGAPFDIHGGGYDLIFPHHENEIAQSEALMPAPPFANVWMHGGLLQFDGRKMSKSLGNFEPLSQLLERHDAQAIRLVFLQTGYRKPMNFTESGIAGATIALARLYDAYDALRAEPAAPQRPGALARSSADATWVAPLRERFFAALDDDMNTSGALSTLFELANATSKIVAAGVAGEAAAFIHEAMGLLGVSPSERTLPKKQAAHGAGAATPVPADFAERVARVRAALGDVVVGNGAGDEQTVGAIVEARATAKKGRDFARADLLRAALAAGGIVLTDTKEGTQWTVDV
jgi:cysteinyl-tRNA synthetase